MFEGSLTSFAINDLISIAVELTVVIVHLSVAIDLIVDVNKDLCLPCLH